MLWLLKVRTKLLRCFPERVNVSADQARILTSNTNKIESCETVSSAAQVINNRKWWRRCLSELLIAIYHLALEVGYLTFR